LDLYTELLELIDALERAAVDYALCGGIAVAFHGYPRFTKDIDLLVREQDLARVKQAVRPLGFILQADPMTFGAGGSAERVLHRVSKVVDGEHLILDLLLVNSALNEVWDDRDLYEWKGRQVRIVSADGLAKMKRMAGRDQDLLDLKKLGRSNEEGD
jgi:hypothetical protein